MGTKNRAERQLCGAIDLLIEEIQQRYDTEISEEAEIDRKLGNIKMRDVLIEQIAEQIRCRKISEKAYNETKVDITYGLQVEITKNRMNYSVSHKRISRAAE